MAEKQRGPDVFFRVVEGRRPFGDRTHTMIAHGVNSYIPRRKHPLYRKPEPPNHDRKDAA